MGQPDEQSIGQLGIGHIASLLGVSVDSLPGDRRQLETLAELTEALLEKNGEEWLGQNGDVILEQWETMLRLGI
ncbi:MAG TPA: hypothetical protein VKF36_14230 [Syntrophorhabdales bacterium]|nr:hypothetical protein [Syntrophorhabdales bacterium]